MTGTGIGGRDGLRRVGAPGEQGFARGDRLVWPDRRLGDVVAGRPTGITGNQWNSAINTRFDFVVCDAGTSLPDFVVQLEDPRTRTPQAERAHRMREAVCAAVGLEVLHIGSASLRPAAHGRRIVEYLIDARRFAATVGDQPEDPLAEPAVGYRDIIGRLPDGRTGFVNDLGAVARAAAVEAYVARQLADPILRGLHVRWKDGVAEGWCWAQQRPGHFLFERIRLTEYRFSCGIDAGRLAEDLAVVAVGERLKTLDVVDPDTHERGELASALNELRRRRDEMAGGFAFEHVTFEDHGASTGAGGR